MTAKKKPIKAKVSMEDLEGLLVQIVNGVMDIQERFERLSPDPTEDDEPQLKKPVKKKLGYAIVIHRLEDNDEDLGDEPFQYYLADDKSANWWTEYKTEARVFPDAWSAYTFVAQHLTTPGEDDENAIPEGYEKLPRVCKV